MSKATAALRALTLQDRLVPMAGVYDALSACLLERAGLPVAFISGYCLAASRLGLPDVGYLTLTEVVENASRIADRVDIPVLCDGDDGYGNHLNVARLVKGLERAGVAGVQIEDQVSPKRCGHMDGKRITGKAEAVAKIKAALDTRQDPDFIIIARTDALAVNGYDDALERAHAFAEAGADIIFVEALTTAAQMAEVPRVIPRPTMFNSVIGGRSPTPSAAEVEALGFRFMQTPDTVFAVTRAMSNFFDEVKRNGTYAAIADQIDDFGALNAIVGLDRIAEFDRRYGDLAR